MSHSKKRLSKNALVEKAQSQKPTSDRIASITPNEQVLSEIAKATEVGGYLWQKEWAERNGGNLSIDLTDIIGSIDDSLLQQPTQPMADMPAAAASQVYFVKGTGERMRDLCQPDRAGCILRVNDSATGYQVIWGGRGRADYQPTSEFLSHVKLLLDARQSGSSHRCVVHTHPHALIALSHHPKFARNPQAYNLACWSMLPEVRAFVPRGIQLVPYVRSGSVALSDITVTALQVADVAVWEKHGAVALGDDALEAFDFIDVANKGATLYLSCLAAGFEPEGLSAAQLKELEDTFHLPPAAF